MKFISIVLLSFVFLTHQTGAQTSDSDVSNIDVYLLTVLPGNEVYSIYGHSAIRIVINDTDYDNVFNWGVFDFETPNFTYKFVKGRLDYLLVGYPYNRFIRDYFSEQRTVISQKINLTASEKTGLQRLIMENLKPENRAYRYDFFFDNCATRIRDILQNSNESGLQYAQVGEFEDITFRQLLEIYQKQTPWLDLGIDMLLGPIADNRAGIQGQMFLPDFLMSNLSDATVLRPTGPEKYLGEPEIVLDFNADNAGINKIKSPLSVFWVLFIIILAISLSKIPGKWMRRIDIATFIFYTLLALLLTFTTFFTDHGAMKLNFHVVWLNPLIIASLFCILFNCQKVFWFRITFIITILFFPLMVILPQQVNQSIIPVILILLVRLFFLSSFRKVKTLHG